jgi:hypothetical protein
MKCSSNCNLNLAYNGLSPVSTEIMGELNDFCQKVRIPEKYYQFYKRVNAKKESTSDHHKKEN